MTGPLILAVLLVAVVVVVSSSKPPTPLDRRKALDKDLKRIGAVKHRGQSNDDYGSTLRK